MVAIDILQTMVTIDTGVLFANLPNRLGHHLVSCHLLLILGSANLGFALHRWQDDVCGARVEDHAEVLIIGWGQHWRARKPGMLEVISLGKP